MPQPQWNGTCCQSCEAHLIYELPHLATLHVHEAHARRELNSLIHCRAGGMDVKLHENVQMLVSQANPVKTILCRGRMEAAAGLLSMTVVLVGHNAF